MGKRIPNESQTTHIVFFNYSLCCLPSVEKMIESLDEAWRVLTPRGILVHFYPFISQSQLFLPINTAEPPNAYPYCQELGFGEGHAFKNAVILRGFELFTEEHILLRSFYSSKINAMNHILTGRSIRYLTIDQHLKYCISLMIGTFITNQDKPAWFSFGKDDIFTLLCQIFVKQSFLTKN